MIGAMVVLAFASEVLHAGRPATLAHDGRPRHYHIAGWRLDVRPDSFKEIATCKLERAQVTYSRAVLTFRFGSKVNTADAYYRVGDGPPLSVGSVAVEAAGLGARLDSSNLTNPSNGEVHIPVDALVEGRRVSIEPNGKTRPRSFDIAGLSAAVDRARAEHCDIT